MKEENVKYFYKKQKESLPTGTCLILVTPDSERTMCTFLGIAGKISENDEADITKELDRVMAKWRKNNENATEDQKKAQEKKEREK